MNKQAYMKMMSVGISKKAFSLNPFGGDSTPKQPDLSQYFEGWNAGGKATLNTQKQDYWTKFSNWIHQLYNKLFGGQEGNYVFQPKTSNTPAEK